MAIIKQSLNPENVLYAAVRSRRCVRFLQEVINKVAFVNHNTSTDLIIALDFPRAEKAFDLVNQLNGLPVIYKIGLELFMGGGPEVVRELVHRKNRIFLDLKLH